MFGPASLSNLGPGYDTLGLCIKGMGDVVTATLCDDSGVRVLCSGDARLPTDPVRNTAAKAANAVLELAGSSLGLALTIRKGIPVGSGIGGSAASATAGAWATNVLLGTPFTREDLVEAVLEGEAVASGGCRHGDNVLPSLFGGLVLTSSVNPADYRCIALRKSVSIAVVLPQLEIMTADARRLLPSNVPLRSAVENASDLAFLIQAISAGDWSKAGRYMMRDRLVEPVRAEFVPCYRGVRKAALAAGAAGCALTGSGPAMFAIAKTPTIANQALEAMRTACLEAGIEADGMVTEADQGGVRTLTGSQQ